MANRDPWRHTGTWGPFATTGDLPNVTGSAFQKGNVNVGDTAYVVAAAALYVCTDATKNAAVWEAVGAGGVSGVTGPGGAVDNTLARFDGVSGDQIQGSNVVLDDLGNLTSPATVQGVDVVATSEVQTQDLTVVGVLDASAATDVLLDDPTITGVMDASAVVSAPINNPVITGVMDASLATTDLGGTTVTGTLEVVGDITVTGTVDGRDLAADGSKLDGISAGAEPDAQDVLVSADDTTPGFLEGKIVAGANITIATLNPGGAEVLEITGTAAGGDVVGPASATDNALARYNGATGKLIQNSNATLSDVGDLVLAGDLSVVDVSPSGTVDGRDVAADGAKLDTIETGADVTDTANVTAAGAFLKNGTVVATGSFNLGGNNITNVGTVDGRDVSVDGAKLDGIEAGATADQTITAGAGLTGGGTGNVTLNVAANADGSIVVNADDIRVGVLASDAQHGNRGGGALHAVATGATAGFMSAADKSKLDGIAPGAGAQTLQEAYDAGGASDQTIAGLYDIDLSGIPQLFAPAGTGAGVPGLAVGATTAGLRLASSTLTLIASSTDIAYASATGFYPAAASMVLGGVGAEWASLRVGAGGGITDPSVNVNGQGGLRSPGSNQVALAAGTIDVATFENVSGIYGRLTLQGGIGAAAPALAIGNATTGWHNAGGGTNLTYAAGGFSRFSFGLAAMTPSGEGGYDIGSTALPMGTVWSQLFRSDGYGTVAAPAFGPADPTTGVVRGGLWAPSATLLAMAVGGVNSVVFEKLTSSLGGLRGDPHLYLRGNMTTEVDQAAITVNNANSLTASTGTQRLFNVSGVVNQSGDAEWRGFEMNITRTAEGSGGGRYVQITDDTQVILQLDATSNNDNGQLQGNDADAGNVSPFYSFINGGQWGLGFDNAAGSLYLASSLGKRLEILDDEMGFFGVPPIARPKLRRLRLSALKAALNKLGIIDDETYDYYWEDTFDRLVLDAGAQTAWTDTTSGTGVVALLAPGEVSNPQLGFGWLGLSVSGAGSAEAVQDGALAVAAHNPRFRARVELGAITNTVRVGLRSDNAYAYFEVNTATGQWRGSTGSTAGGATGTTADIIAAVAGGVYDMEIEVIGGTSVAYTIERIDALGTNGAISEVTAARVPVGAEVLGPYLLHTHVAASATLAVDYVSIEGDLITPYDVA